MECMKVIKEDNLNESSLSRFIKEVGKHDIAFVTAFKDSAFIKENHLGRAQSKNVIHILKDRLQLAK